MDISIIDEIGLAATLEQCAEECMEFGHACLKLSRIIRKENPTPVTFEEAAAKFREECVDVVLTSSIACSHDITDIDQDVFDRMYVEKRTRWIERIEKMKAEKESK